MNHQKIRVVETDPETRDAITTEFNSWSEVAEFVQEKLAEQVKEKVDGSEATA